MAFLVKVFVGDRDDHKSPGREDPNPLQEGGVRIGEMLEAVAGVNEVDLIVRTARHDLGVAVLEVPSPHGAHAGENAGVLAERIRATPDVDAIAYEIASMKQPVVKRSFGALALLPHSATPGGSSFRGGATRLDDARPLPGFCLYPAAESGLDVDADIEAWPAGA